MKMAETTYAILGVLAFAAVAGMFLALSDATKRQNEFDRSYRCTEVDPDTAACDVWVRIGRGSPGREP
jgi:hypothetical protein